MKSWLIRSGFLFLALSSALWAQSSPPASATDKSKKDTKSYYAIEKLALEPADLGLDAVKTIDGMVINVKNPAKVIANDHEQSVIVMSSEFREKNQRFAGLGMHSWLSVSYKITEENNKVVTLWIMEFDSPEHAKRFGGVQPSDKDDGDDNRDAEFKGSVFYQYIHNALMLKITWVEPKTPAVDKVLTAYKARIMAY